MEIRKNFQFFFGMKLRTCVVIFFTHNLNKHLNNQLEMRLHIILCSCMVYVMHLICG